MATKISYIVSILCSVWIQLEAALSCVMVESTSNLGQVDVLFLFQISSNTTEWLPSIDFIDLTEVRNYLYELLLPFVEPSELCFHGLLSESPSLSQFY